MRKLIVFVLTLAFSLCTSGLAFAHDKHGHHGRHGKFVKFDRDDGPIGLIRVRPVNFGQRRSSLAHQQNAERRALHQHQKQERKLFHARGLSRRNLAMHQREEKHMLRLERELIKQHR
jgi:hypothetical protein